MEKTTITIQIPVDLKEKADKKADSMDMPTAQYIRKLIKEDVINGFSGKN